MREWSAMAMVSEHLCHADRGNIPVPPRMLFWRRHGYMLPKGLREEVWRHYRPGQEVDKRPAHAFLDGMRRAIASVRQKEKREN